MQITVSIHGLQPRLDLNAADVPDCAKLDDVWSARLALLVYLE